MLPCGRGCLLPQLLSCCVAVMLLRGCRAAFSCFSHGCFVCLVTIMLPCCCRTAIVDVMPAMGRYGCHYCCCVTSRLSHSFTATVQPCHLCASLLWCHLVAITPCRCCGVLLSGCSCAVVAGVLLLLGCCCRGCHAASVGGVLDCRVAGVVRGGLVFVLFAVAWRPQNLARR